MKKSKIYTKTGDLGETGLVSGTRALKSDQRIDLYGEVDELNSRVGALVAKLAAKDRVFLEEIQSALFDLGPNLACEASQRAQWKLPVIGEGWVKKLESSIDLMDSTLSPLQHFILPGGSEAAVAAHLCRTHCRLVERRMVAYHQETQEPLPEHALQFINRLSDYFFVFARWCNHQAQISEAAWKPRN